MPRKTLAQLQQNMLEITLEPMLATQLCTLARLDNKTLTQTCNEILAEWMSTTGDLLIDVAINLLTTDAGEDADESPDNLLEFPDTLSEPPLITVRRTSNVQHAFRHKAV